MANRKEIVERLAMAMYAPNRHEGVSIRSNFESWSTAYERREYRERAGQVLDDARKAGLTITLKPKRRASGK